MKNHNFPSENYHFYSREKLQHITWAFIVMKLLFKYETAFDVSDTLKCISTALNYENMSMQYTAIFHGSKNENVYIKNDNFLIFAENIDCGYTSEPPQ